MSHLSYQDVLSILRLIDSATFSHLEVEFEGTRVKVARSGGTEAAAAPAPNASVVVAPSPAPEPRAAAAPKTEVAAKPAQPASTPQLAAGEIAVKPPMEGTFYAAPAPGQPPFATLGQRVRKGDQLGTVEVMKLFTAVSAPCDGTVSRIFVANEEVVAKEQVLMIVAADEGAAS